MKPIRLSDLAERDLDEIWLSIAERAGSVQPADGTVQAIMAALAVLARNPRAGSRRDEIDTGVRGFPVGRSIVYSEEHERHLVVARVLHGMRDQRAAFFPDSQQEG